MIRAMTAMGNAPQYTGTFGPHTAVREGIAPALKSISAETGTRIDTVHLVLPYEEVRVQTFKFQKMEFQDAVKVARRKIISETGDKEPVFFLTPLGTEGKLQTYLAEILQTGSVGRYLKIFSEHKIRLKTLTTSFQAGLKVFGSMPEPGAETTAVFDIDVDTIEATVYHRSQPVYYTRQPFGPFDGEADQSALSQDRVDKMKLYRIIDSIYKINLMYTEARPDNPIGKLWLCGSRGGTEGIREALVETMNINVAQLTPFRETGKETYPYTALAGILAGVEDKTLANFISRESQWLSGRSGRIILAVSGILYAFFLVFWIYAVESRHAKMKQELEGVAAELKAFELGNKSSLEELKQMEGLQRLEKGQKVLYGLFGYLANTIPEGVYLERISFRQQGDRNMMELEFVIRADAGIETKSVLSRIDEIISLQPLLKRSGEPAVSSGTKGTDKVVRVKVVCVVGAG
jgi:hypothetical protein